MSSTSPGNECKCAGYIPLYLCRLESAIYCILCIGFSPVCLTPKTTALTERVPRGLLKKASVIFFLPLYAVWNRMDDFHGNGEIRLKSGMFLIKTQTKSAKCFVQLSEQRGGGGSKCFFFLLFRNRCLSSPTAFTKRLSHLSHTVCLPQPISRGQQCSAESELPFLIAALESRLLKQQQQTKQMPVAEVV